MITSENDVRVSMFNAFMECPHRDTDQASLIHAQLQERDPVFYSHLASWYRKNGDIRDHNELFIAYLCTDPFVDNREVGLALFREQPVWMKNRIVGFIKGKTVKIREKIGTKKLGKKTIPDIKITEKKVGLNKNLTSALRSEIQSYLNWLEGHPEQLDATAMRNARDLKELYFTRGKKAFTHGDRVQKILFEKNYPEDSKLSVYKKIMEASTSEAVATLIVQNKIPYTVAVGLVDKITPPILVALINNMSSQEVINNIASLKEKGAWDHPDIKKLIEGKLVKAKTSTKVSALKSKTAVSTGRIEDEELEKKLHDIADVQIKKSGIIKIPTAIFVDRSGSMTEAIKVGKNAAALISGISESDLYVVAFDDAPMGIVAKGKTMTDWEKAFLPVRPGGSTSMGCALMYLLQKKAYVEQIVVITDEGENAQPYFKDVFEVYAKAMKVRPHVTIIRVASMDTTFRNSLERAGIPFDVYSPKGNDYYGLPGLVTLLSRKSKLDLIMEIMDYPLAKKNAFR